MYRRVRPVKEESTDFTSVQTAINDSISGDVILIYPGTYVEVVTLNKYVHLVGMTPSPELQNVVIKPPATVTAGSLLVNNFTFPGTSDTLVIEHLTLEAYGSWACATTNGNVNKVLYNRCNFRNCTYSYAGGQAKTVLRNCNLHRGYAHTNDANNIRVEKCIHDGVWYAYSGNPSLVDSKAVPTVDYGVGYGLPFYAPSARSVKGYVKYQGSLIPDVWVGLFKMETKALVNETVTDSNGEFEFYNPTSDTEYFVLAYSGSISIVQNILVV